MRKGIFSASKEIFNPQGPHSQIFMMGGGGGGTNRGSYFLPKKITTSEFVYPKKSLLFLTYPKKSLSSFFATQKNPSVFFATQKNPGVFHRPKKITFGQNQNFRPKNITRTPPPLPPSLKYVSGAPGIQPLSLCNQVTYCTTAYLNRLLCILLGRIPMLLLFLKLLHRHLKE